MTLELNRDEVEKKVKTLTDCLVDLVKSGARACKASFNAEARLCLSHNAGNDSNRVISASLPYDSGLEYSYSSRTSPKGDVSGELAFRFRDDVKKHGFLLLSNRKFNDAVHAIFGSKRSRYNGPRGLEETGIRTPEKIDVKVEYSGHSAFWRTYPKEFLDRVSGFTFQGQFGSIYWPLTRRYSDCHEPDAGSRLSVSVSNHGDSQKSEAAEEALKESLVDSGIARREQVTVKQHRDYSKTVDKIIINPKDLNYDLLQRLEELARQVKLEVKDDEGRVDSCASIEISGKNLCRDTFLRVIDVPGVNVTGSVRSGNIEVRCGPSGFNMAGYGSNRPEVMLHDASFEDLARFIQTGFEFSGLSIVSQMPNPQMENCLRECIFPLIQVEKSR